MKLFLLIFLISPINNSFVHHSLQQSMPSLHLLSQHLRVALKRACLFSILYSKRYCVIFWFKHVVCCMIGIEHETFGLLHYSAIFTQTVTAVTLAHSKIEEFIIIGIDCALLNKSYTSPTL